MKIVKSMREDMLEFLRHIMLLYKMHKVTSGMKTMKELISESVEREILMQRTYLLRPEYSKISILAITWLIFSIWTLDVLKIMVVLIIDSLWQV